MAKITQTMISQLLAAVGGSSNVSKCGNCMTRLRLTLANNGVADQAVIKQIPGVMGVVESDEQFQIILGPGKAQQAAELMNKLIESVINGDVQEQAIASDTNDLSSVAAEQKKQMKRKQTSAVQRFLSKFATIFTPLIPGFIAAGLLLGFATLLEQMFVLEQTPSQFMLDLIAYMKVFGKGLFAFLSILIGYNAQQAFGGSGVNGAILASLFVLGYNPDATSGIYSGMSEFFGYTIDPRGNIIGVLLAAIIGAQVERKVREYMPDDLDMILTSVVTLLIMGVVTFVVIMPIGGELFKGMSWLFLNLNDNPLGAAILAGLFLISVVFGIHQGFVPVYFALMEAQGFNSLFPILAMAGGGRLLHRLGFLPWLTCRFEHRVWPFWYRSDPTDDIAQRHLRWHGGLRGWPAHLLRGRLPRHLLLWQQRRRFKLIHSSPYRNELAAPLSTQGRTP